MAIPTKNQASGSPWAKFPTARRTAASPQLENENHMLRSQPESSSAPTEVKEEFVKSEPPSTEKKILRALGFGAAGGVGGYFGTLGTALAVATAVGGTGQIALTALVVGGLAAAPVGIAGLVAGAAFGWLKS